MSRGLWLAWISLLGWLVATSPILRAQDGASLSKLASDFVVKRDCNSSNCHGSKVPEDRLGKRAGDLWNLHDPHSNAYLSLRTERSQAIIRQLVSGASGSTMQVDDPEYHRILEAQCVSCHASESSPIAQRSAGVDCQACHGPATAWQDTHLLQSWRDLEDARFDDKSAIGRINTSSPWQLASVCGSCHIGEMNRSGVIEFDDGTSVVMQPREVSHRLMAAGHPPTYFELGHYLRRYPKHWRDLDNVAGASASIPKHGDDPSPVAGRALDTWRIGKIVNAKQRLDLLANRLTKSEWPELTEHRCTSCHHPLVAPQEQQQQDKSTSRPWAPWDGWYLEQVDLALELTDFPDIHANGESESERPNERWNLHHAKLRELMDNPLMAHRSDYQSVISAEITALQSLLDPIISNKLPILHSTKIQSIRRSWTNRNLTNASSVSWESAVQVRLTAVALSNAKDPSGEYPPYALERWDLPVEAWHRNELLPYSASSEFDRSRFYEQLQELKKSLD